MWHRIRIETNGKTQGPFHGDDPDGKPGPSACDHLRWSAKKSNDHGRAGTTASATASANKPIEVLKPYGPSTPQYWAAYWSNEILTTVTIKTFYSDGSGATDRPFQILTLTNATIVSIKQHVQHLSRESAADAQPAGVPVIGLDRLRFQYEQIKVEHPDAKTHAMHGLPSKTGLPSMPTLPKL